MLSFLSSRLPYFLLIALALLIAALRPFEGSLLALVLVMLGQLYLPGWLLARAFGKLTAPHPITRFAWMLACGIGLVTVLGGVLRLLQVNVTVYIALLHGLMLLLALLPAPPQPDPDTRWRLTRANAPLYALLVLLCLVMIGVSVERNSYRFSGYADQTVFVSLMDWLAHDPDDPDLRSRRAGVSIGDARFDTDGWTYAQAAWVRSSGRPAADLLWYDMAPLFAWTMPLLMFALAYAATGRERAAALTAGMTVLAGLVVLDSLVYSPTNLAFGQYGVFQYNTLRTFSRAIVLPLALFVTLEYLRQPRWRDLLLVLLLGVAIALFHPLQIMAYGIAAGGGALVWWLVQPRRRLGHALALGVVMLLMLIVPLAQRSVIYINTDTATAQTEEAVIDGGRTRHSSALQAVEDLPLLGDSYIVNLRAFFYHPLIAVVAVLGLVMIVAVRHSLAAQFIFGATVAVLVLSFTPGLTPIFARLTYIAALSSMVFVLPVGLTLGISADFVAGRLPRGRNWISAVGVTGVILLLIFEPLPIPASARDQLYASHQLQVGRDMHPSDQVLLDTISESVDTSQRTVWLSPTDRANFIIESIPHTLITGGRAGTGNLASNRATGRFLNEAFSEPAPFLDAADLAFIVEMGVTHYVVPADASRLPLLHLQPERFAFIARAAGYDLFAGTDAMQPDAIDSLFGEMNTAYASMTNPRWQPGHFNLILPGDPVLWLPFVDRWSALLAEDETNDRARHGLAFSYLLAGDDDAALSLWQSLHERQPELTLYTLALAYTQHILGDAPAGFDVLWTRLQSSDNPAEQVLIARALLTDPFFYLLDEARMDAVLAVAADYPVVWDQLVLLDDVDETRRLASLMLLAGRWSQAVALMGHLPDVSLSPQDLVALAAAHLAQGDVETALAALAPALDADWRAAKAYYHQDRWRVNEAAQVYYLLQGEIAARAGRLADAEAAYQQAVDAGAETAGAYFLAVLAGEIPGDMPELVSLLTIADTGQLYAADPIIERGPDETALDVSAVYSDILPFAAPYPVEIWRLQVIDAASGETYALLDAPADFVPGALVRARHTLAIDADVPPLAAALASVQPRHDNAITATTLFVPTTLNRPDAAALPTDAVAVGCRFGEQITLEAYAAAGRNITLYWRADEPLPQDYQVFVHLLGPDGDIIEQVDRTPVEGRYPTSQWRAAALIADPYTFAELPADYGLRVGLYTLPDVVRLPVTAAPDTEAMGVECAS